jgi:hypothetical protein
VARKYLVERDLPLVPLTFLAASVLMLGVLLVIRQAVIDALPGRALKAAAVLVIAGGIMLMASVSRDISRDFEPFGPIVLSHDVIVRQWAAVPAEIRDYLADKTHPGASARLSSNPAEAIESVWFGLHPWETTRDGSRLRWMSGPATHLYVRPTARSLRIPFRHEYGAFREPVPVTIVSGGRTLDRTVVTDGRWHQSLISLRPLARRNLARMHDVEVSIPHAWIPALMIPRSQDTRTLGLQIGAIEVH